MTEEITDDGYIVFTPSEDIETPDDVVAKELAIIEKNLDPDGAENRAVAQANADSSIDFKSSVENAIFVFQNHLRVASDPSSTLEDVLLAKEKAASVLEHIKNNYELQQYRELAETYDKEFKRSDELDVLNPLLEAHKEAAILCRDNILWVGKSKKDLMQDAENDGIIDIERQVAILNAETLSLDNLKKVSDSFDKVLKLQKSSAMKMMGERKDSPKAVAQLTSKMSARLLEEKGAKEEEDSKSPVRPLTPEEKAELGL